MQQLNNSPTVSRSAPDAGEERDTKLLCAARRFPRPVSISLTPVYDVHCSACPSGTNARGCL